MKRVFNLLVVDESGSMEIIRKQALVGINETLETIRKIQKAHSELEQCVTLITFDSTHKKLFYDNVAADDACSLSMRDYRPCGGTPLYDTIGMGIAKINAQAAEDDNVLVTIVTDGEENCSEEYSLRMITFQEDEEGTKKMFARENFSRVRYSACLAKGVEMPEGGYFDKKKK